MTDDSGIFHSPVTRVPMTSGSGISSGRSLNSITSAAFRC